MKAQASSFIKRGTINNYVRGCLVAMLLLACCGLYALNSRIAKVEAQAPVPSMPGRILNNFGNSEGFAIGAYNTDGTNPINLTALQYRSYFFHPSQSKQTGMIAFAGCGDFSTPVPRCKTRIFVMNGDGTNIRQITSAPDLTAGDDQSDSSPVISPDGTKVAFISGRANYPLDANGQRLGEEVYVVNVDGTNLHQVSTKQVFQINSNGTVARSKAYSVAWSPDSASVAVRCDRKYRLAGSDVNNKEFFADYDSLNSMIRIFSVDAANDGTLVAISLLPYRDNDPYHGANFSQKADKDKAINNYDTDGYPRIAGLYGVMIDWSPTGDTIIASIATVARFGGGFLTNPVAVYYGVFNPSGGLRTTLTSQALIGGDNTGNYNGDGTRELCYRTPGCARISPDGQQLVYGSYNANANPNNETRIANIDGSNAHTIGTSSTLGGYQDAKWWSAGAPIPTPVQLVLKPNPVSVNQNQTAQLLPMLLDAQGNVIARAASYARFFDSFLSTGVVCDSAHPCSGNASTPTVNANGVLTGTDSNGSVTFCAENAGLIGCTVVQNYNKQLLTVSATTPETYKSGGGGSASDGVFTVSRGGEVNTSAVTFTFATGGTAQRDVDYALVDAAGNTITGNTVTTSQASAQLRVRPLNSSNKGDRTVVLTLQNDPAGKYLTDSQSNSATVTIRDDSSTAFSLTSMTPTRGSNQGVVTATITGKNIKQGATVKLVRAGQSDIVGEAVVVAPGGTSVTARFNLIGQQAGAWTVVVTNPDNTTRQSGTTPEFPAFIIEADKRGGLAVNILGRSAIRGGQSQTYTVEYSNYGNTDAYAVPLWIMGIPRDAEVILNFNVVSPLDVPNHPSLPAFTKDIPFVVKTENGSVIPLLLPIVPAGSKNYLRFTLRFPQVRENSTQDFTLRAVITTPLLNAVNASPATTAKMLAHQDLSTTPKPDIQPSNAVAFVTSAEGADCLNSLFQSAVNCALGFIPGEACALAAVGALQTAAQVLTEQSLAAKGTSASPLSFAQLFGGIASIAGCAASVAPGLSQALAIISCESNLYATAIACDQDANDFKAKRVQSRDPNEKTGRQGAGDAHFISGKPPLPYDIIFENKPDATAPAQTVVVTDQLDAAKLDLSTFSLGVIGFGDTFVTPPDGAKTFSTTVDLRPANNLLVNIAAGLDDATGIVTWRFTSLDPATNQPTTDARAGFLPPNINGTQGEGSVVFTIQPKDLQTGAEIRNKARIVFDVNAALDTNFWLNTIDNSTPVSRVTTLDASQSSIVFNVKWTGTDTGSGIDTYTIYVSENGGAFTIWRDGTTDAAGLFVGQPGKTYSFYSVARDKAGNIESAKTTAEATTTVVSSSLQNSIDDPRFFVRQQYLDFLNREPDQGGFDYWTSLITSCPSGDAKCINSKRVSVSAAFFIEQEFQDTGSFVYRFYKGSLGRQPAYSEFVQDRSRVIGGTNLEASKAAFAETWTQRAEFLAKYPAALTADQFVDALLQTVKQTSGVDLTSQRQTFVNQLQAGGTRGQVIRAVVDAKAFQAAEYNRAFVLMQYFGYLRRDPDTGGYNFWLDILNNRVPNNYRSMVCAFITSAEYQLRFSSVVTRTDQVCGSIGQ